MKQKKGGLDHFFARRCHSIEGTRGDKAQIFAHIDQVSFYVSQNRYLWDRLRTMSGKSWEVALHSYSN